MLGEVVDHTLILLHRLLTLVVGGVGGIEQQEGRLASGRGEVQDDTALRVLQLGVEAGLLGDIRHQLRFQFQEDQLMLSGLQNLHLTLLV